MLKNFFDPSTAVLRPSDIACSLTGKTAQELLLPRRAIITFRTGDIKRIVNSEETAVNRAWQPFRILHHIRQKETIVAQSSIGGPAIAALVEELAAFGVRECILWGYCGSLRSDMNIGDIIVAKSALREEGVSHHYLDSDEDFVESNWFQEWTCAATDSGFREGVIWSCDALYRETVKKISRYRAQGIAGVEMEVASFYAVCRYRAVKSIAFLVVSDSFREERWHNGFGTRSFKEGVGRFAKFVVERVIC